MNDEFVMGIDNGGTFTKAAIYDRRGKVIASAAQSTRMLTPQEHHTERDMDELWGANLAVIRQALEQSGIAASQIKGIAVTGHGNGLYLVDKSGHPLRNGIISTDSRAKEYVERWQNSPEFISHVLPKTMQSVWAGQSVVAGLAEGPGTGNAAKNPRDFNGEGPGPLLADRGSLRGADRYLRHQPD